MLIEFFIIFQVVMLITFFVAFFTHEEMMWIISFALSGILMIISYNIQFMRYVFDSGTGAYVTEIVTNSYPVLMSINMVFFVLSMAMGLFDIFDKYGIKLLPGKLK